MRRTCWTACSSTRSSETAVPRTTLTMRLFKRPLIRPAMSLRKFQEAAFTPTWFPRMAKSISADIVSSLFGLRANMSPYNATNPDVSSLRRDPVMYYILQSRWTGTITPRLLLQGGFTLNKEDFNVLYQPGVQKVPF